ncbi:hypothetical protein FXO38_27935 [Capsicum annuum]|nr:hypothetical protein FXO37_32592 [Capsicum annuum]KAF3629013.1 hypothetical protein FXO38_27935 [Capsicum annuum]
MLYQAGRGYGSGSAGLKSLDLESGLGRRNWILLLFVGVFGVFELKCWSVLSLMLLRFICRCCCCLKLYAALVGWSQVFAYCKLGQVEERGWTGSWMI